MLTLFPLYVLLSLIIGYFGRHRRLGFWGLTFGSILFTPLMGFIVLLVTDDVKPKPAER